MAPAKEKYFQSPTCFTRAISAEENKSVEGEIIFGSAWITSLYLFYILSATLITNKLLDYVVLNSLSYICTLSALQFDNMSTVLFTYATLMQILLFVLL